MAKFGINDILNAKTKAAGQQAQGYKEIYLSPYEVKAAEENTHQKLEGIEELADSFLHVGQEQPTVLAMGILTSRAHEDMTLAILQVQAAYGLPAYLTDLIVTAVLADIRGCANKDLLNALSRKE